MTEERDHPASGRFAGLGWRSAPIAGGAAAVGLIALVALSDPSPEGSHYTVGANAPAQLTASADPLRAELARCRTLPANADDVGCRTAWDVNFRRFMGESRSFVTPAEAASAPVLDALASSQPVPVAPSGAQTVKR